MTEPQTTAHAPRAFGCCTSRGSKGLEPVPTQGACGWVEGASTIAALCREFGDHYGAGPRWMPRADGAVRATRRALWSVPASLPREHGL